jgi:hypothetical protein
VIGKPGSRDSEAKRTSDSIWVFPRSRIGSSKSRENFTNKLVWGAGLVVLDPQK